MIKVAPWLAALGSWVPRRPANQSENQIVHLAYRHLSTLITRESIWLIDWLIGFGTNHTLSNSTMSDRSSASSIRNMPFKSLHSHAHHSDQGSSQQFIWSGERKPQEAPRRGACYKPSIQSFSTHPPSLSLSLLQTFRLTTREGEVSTSSILLTYFTSMHKAMFRLSIPLCPFSFRGDRLIIQRPVPELTRWTFSRFVRSIQVWYDLIWETPSSPRLGSNSSDKWPW